MFAENYYISKEAVLSALETNSMFNAIHNGSVIKVDFICKKRGEYSDLAFGRKRNEKIAGFNVSIISKEDLILSKLSWSKESLSEMQSRDIRNLLQTGVDDNYLNAMLKKLGLKSHFEKIKKA